MSILQWTQAGATASYGTMAEPCNYTQKFPAHRASLAIEYYDATVRRREEAYSC